MKNALLMLTIVFSSLVANAQSFKLAHDHSTIQVEDVDKSMAFYKDILQLKEVPTPWPGYNMIRFLETGTNK